MACQCRCFSSSRCASLPFPQESTPRNEKERLQVLETMVAHAQFCRSGDNTLRGTQMAIQVRLK